jgi:virginiamycin B lyase
MKAFLIAVLALGFAGAARADAIAGMGMLSGMVSAAKPFKAAKVYARHVEKNIVFMVYTEKGKYRAVNMFPGDYDVSVQKAGFAADTQRVKIEAGKTAVVDFALKDAPASKTYMGSRTLKDIEFAAYDEIYKPGPGRELVEKTCIICHGVNFLPGLPQGEDGWNAALDFMLNTNGAFGVEDQASMMDPNLLKPGERETILEYLVANIGPDMPVRAVRDDSETPLDEAALGQAQYVEYNFPNTAEMPARWTQEPHFDRDGNVWVTERGVPSAITKLDPRTGAITNYMNPDPKGSPHGLVVDKDGMVWWAGRDVYLARLNPKTGAIKEYKVDQIGWHGHTPVLDSKGNIWFSMLPGNKIGKWDRATDTIKYWENPTPRGRPYGFIMGPDDKPWYAEFHTCKIATFDPATETFIEYSVITHPCAIRRLGMDSKRVVWFGLFSHGKLGRLDTKTGAMSEIDLPTPYGEPYDVWPDHDGNIWISDGAREGTLIKYDQKKKTFTYYPSPQRTDMPKLALTRHGAIWYAPRMVAMSGGGLAGLGVLYPDKSKMKEHAAYYR